ncbi:MAG TPA: MFS transporter [Limnochordales bacterium]
MAAGRTPLRVFGCVAAFTIAQYVSVVVIPLYAAREGLGPVVLGAVASVPGLLMLLLRVPAGLLIDRHGARRVTALAVAGMGAGGVLLLTAALRWLAPLVAIVLAQACFGTARAAFWPAIRTYLTWWDHGTRTGRFGMLNVVEGCGGVAGPAVTGVLFAAAGPVGAAWLLLGMGTAGCLAGWLMPELKPAGEKLPVAATAGRHSHTQPGGRALAAGEPVSVWHLRPVYVGGACDFSASLVLISLSTFLPVYLLLAGLSESQVGLLTAVRGLALAAAGPLYHRLFPRGSYQAAWLAGMGLTGLGHLMIPLFTHPLPLTIAISLMGLGGGILQVLSSMVVAEFTPRERLGLAMAYSGIFRSVGILVVPAALGFAVDALGLASAFLLPAVPLLAAAAGSGPLLRWGLAQPPGVPSTPASPG